MVFSSLLFLLLFLPILLALYFLSGDVRWRNGVLLLFSLVFYAWGEPKWIVCMVGVTTVNYACAIGLDRARSAAWKKGILILGTTVSLGVLFYFKYAAFFLTTASDLLGLGWNVRQTALPIGISFYTFQILTYTVDVYRKNVPPQRNFFRLLLYVSCFPQLIAGPIVRYSDMRDKLDQRKVSLTDFSNGMGRFAIGLSKKVVLANLCGEAVELLLPGGAAASMAGAWLSALLYTFQIYFDFSAYSDMAIGLGKVLGFTYRENFRYPYVSESVSEFWRRWHISLGSFFREYVYIPLGGNRKGGWITARNLLIVWALTGLWHGASWNFVLWGMYYGGWILLERFLLSRVLDRIPTPLRIFGTFILVLIGWVLFYHPSLADGWKHIQALFGVGVEMIDSTVRAVLSEYTVLPLIALICCLPILPWCKAAMRQRPKLGKSMRILAWIAQSALLILSLAFLVGQSYNPFIYFRF